ncbi:MAG: tetratricopeptide repeat-containing sensor histidine kinase [Candidatus Delongbacteria bacterium]|jgi:signal transduction histidine kinase|nr:tetratricopeptide repeat-containing sensor histidine kinase [Candidatus Delongbacteria bacterium]
MEAKRSKISTALGKLKEEVHYNFNGKNFQKITEKASALLKRSEKINYQAGRFSALNILGGACFNISDYEKAQKYYIESMAVANEMKDDIKIALSLNNIGIIFFTLKDYNKALEYYKKALDLKIKTNNQMGISTSYSNIGLAYNMLNESDKALDYFKKSLKIDKKTKNTHAECRALVNIGLALHNIGNTEKALEFYKKSYSLSKKNEYKKYIATALTNLASIYLEMGNTDKALEKALEGKELSQELHSNIHILHFYNVIHKAYKKNKEFEKAYNYLQKFIEFEEKVFKDESQNRIFDLQIKYESEQKAKETEFYRIKTEELSRINASKDKFFKIIHHDLLNPFTAIKSTSELLNNFYDNLTEKKKRSNIRNIYRSSEKILEFINNLFAWVKTQSGEIEFKPERIDISRLIKNNLEFFEHNLSKKEISTEENISKKYIIYADRNMTDTVCRNIIANAIKFTHHEGTIKISLRKYAGMIQLKVKDNGVGIERSRISNLFTISESVTTPGTDDEKGTGLGLILVKEFMDMNKGSIGVKSTPREGTEFTLKFPLAVR